jgi:hypothetical protein
VVGWSAAALQGAPVVTQDVDLWFEDLNDPRIGEALRDVDAATGSVQNRPIEDSGPRIGESVHRRKLRKRRGFRRRDADGCDRDGRAPRSRVLRTAGAEWAKLRHFQISHREKFDKSHGQKGL